MKQYHSKKYIKVISFGSLVETLNKGNDGLNKLLIHTANGIYEGYLKFSEDTDNIILEKDSDILTIAKSLYLKTLKNNDEKTDLIEIHENHITIDLEEVTLHTSSNMHIHMPFVSIFIDQIIGISIGSLDNNN